MRFPSPAPKRALITVACTGVALFIGLASGAGPAWAHVRVDADNPGPGTTSVVTFRVPGESENGSLTTKLSVRMPGVASARTELMPGWTASLERDKAAGTVSSVTWTANQQVGISPEYPAPVLSLTSAQSTATDDHPKMALAAQPVSADNTARWLAGGALILAAVGVAAALIARRRT